MGIEATSFDTSAATTSANRTPESSTAANDDGEMTFWDLLDVINPLQQLPIVGSIYRELSGDTIKPASRIMGGVLFGGLTGGLSLLGCVTGGASALANVVVEQETGKDIAGNAIAAAFGDDDVKTAENTPRAAPVGPPIQITPLPPPSGSSTAVPVVADASSVGYSARIKWNADPVVHSDKIVHVTLDDVKNAIAAKPAASGTAESSSKPVNLASASEAGATAATSGGKPLSLLGATAGAATTEAPRRLLAAGEVPHPTRMPTRDTVPANTTQARRAAEEVASRRYTSRDTGVSQSSRSTFSGRGTSLASTAPTSTTVPARPSTAAAATTVQATPPVAANTSNLAPTLDPSTLPDVMLRNLEKYQRAKRATVATDDTRVDIAG